MNLIEFNPVNISLYPLDKDSAFFKKFCGLSAYTYKKDHLPVRKRSMPLVEDNFSKNGILTFRESLTPTLYTLDNGLVNSFYIDYGTLQISEETLSAPPEEVFERMDNADYAITRKYMENEDYVFLHTMVTKPDVMEPEMFYWIIDKNSNKEKLIRIKDVIETSYLLALLSMTDDNMVYFLGYDIAYKEEWVDDDNNPSVVGIEMEKLFKYEK